MWAASVASDSASVLVSVRRGPSFSQLFTTSPDNVEPVAMRMGALDGDPGVRPGAHQFVDYAAPWHPIPHDGLPWFPERVPWR